MNKAIFTFLVVWLRVMVSVLLAQDFTWENISAENQGFQSVLVVAQDSEIIFAGQAGNVLKSENSGKNWQRMLALRGRMRKINALVVKKDHALVIYAATDNGLYRSDNSGGRWERIFRGKNDLENQCSAVGINGQVILAGTKTGLFISRDNGRHWYKQKSGLGNCAILNIDTGSGRDKIIYLAAENGIFRSLDNGESWEDIFTEFGRKESEAENNSLDTDEPDRKLKVRFVKQDENNTNLLYFASIKGIYRSLNQGKSWEKLTEYGLLNPDVKMLCLSDSLGIVALTESGVFCFKEERWQEISFALAAGRLNFLALDRFNNIYIAGEKGVYKLKQNQTSVFKHTLLMPEYLKSEPSIRSLQEAAIKYAEVHPGKISQWRKDAARRAFLPQVSIGLDRNSTDLWHWEGGSTTKSDDDALHRGKDNIDWDVSLTWDLSDLIWNDAQTSIDVRSKLLVELRDDILDQVNKLYFERLRVKNELDNLAIEDRHKRFQTQLKLEELTASLDSLTNGYYSEQLRWLAYKQQG